MRCAINGLGRIGRLILKIGLEKGINFTAINNLSDPKTTAYLLKYDSVYGVYNKEVSYGDDYIQIGNKRIKVFSEKDPSKIPWKIDCVVEAVGLFTDKKNASKHLHNGAKKVIITAPSKDSDVVIVPGVNDKLLRKEHRIISMGSCTTNCLAPMVKVLDDYFKIKRAFMTTVHAYTNNQALLDSAHKKLRRGRAAAVNMIPTTSGATQSVIQVIPSMKGKLDGLAVRVPIVVGSLTDLVAELNVNVSDKEVNNAFKKVSKSSMKGILEYSEEELVSSDIIGNCHSCIIDGLSTKVTGNLVKVLGWYDNEYGYSCRMVELIKRIK